MRASVTCARKGLRSGENPAADNPRCSSAARAAARSIAASSADDPGLMRPEASPATTEASIGSPTAQRICALRQYSVRANVRRTGAVRTCSADSAHSFATAPPAAGLFLAWRAACAAIPASSRTRRCGTDPRNASVTCRSRSGTGRPPAADTRARVASVICRCCGPVGQSAKNRRWVGSCTVPNFRIAGEERRHPGAAAA